MSVNNEQVAHLWASGRKDRASGYSMSFEGRALYSWGSHYLLGWRLLPATFFLNSERYSQSTSKHQCYARRAVHGRWFHVEGLTKYRYELETISDYATATGDAAKRQHDAAMRAAVHMVNALAPHLNREMAETLLDVADVPNAARVIDAANREHAAKEKAAASHADKARRAAISDYARRPWGEFAAWLESNVTTLRTGTQYTRDNALHAIRHAAKVASGYHRDATRVGLSEATRAKVWRRVKAMRAAIAEHEAKGAARARLAAFRLNRERLADGLARVAAMPASVEAPGYVFGAFRSISTAATMLRGVPAMSAATSARLSSLIDWADARNDWESGESARIANAKRAGEIAAWRAGEAPRSVRFDSEHGGAAIRAVGVTRDDAGAITGGTLQTSHGADVPLVEAVRAFRFVKLCRERGEGWQRNGRTVRVGYYQIDRVTASGGFVAGCHRFAWGEIEALAVALGVFDLPADAAAVVPSHLAA